jgi:putative phosphoribosyl transferase
MRFKDRVDAGKQLVLLLTKYIDDPNAIVVGLPRGGVVNAYEVAKGLNLPLDVTCPRKIGAPFNPELAIGAITETGEGIFNHSLLMQLDVPQIYIQKQVEIEKKVAQQRLVSYRKDRPATNFSGKTVILVDDGLATGATMKAAIKSIKAAGAKRIVVAVPVSPPNTFEEIKALVNEAVTLATPAYFSAVGQFYEEFYPTEDEEVVKLLQNSKKPT